jgi:hypothetical protein
MERARAYFLERAEAELRLGEQAGSKPAADLHFERAGRYFDIAYRRLGEPGPSPNRPAIAV